MSTFETILPSNAGPLELALERATAFPELPISALADLSDPADIDSDFLPWLAYRFATDFWLDEWDEETRRDVLKQQFDLHRLKGTEEGTRRMLALVGARLVQTITYPQRIFAMGSITKEQRNAWLARMPQIRVYLVSAKGKKEADAFAGADGRRKGAFAGNLFARLDRGAALYGRKAVLRSADGVEVTLRRSTVETVTETKTAVQADRIHIPGEAGPALFVRGFAGRGFATSKNKQASIVTYSLDRTYDSVRSTLHLDTVAPGLTPIDVKYERVSDIGTAGPSLFVGRFLRNTFVTDDDAEQHLYDRVYLHDDTVDAPWSRAHSFVGHARIGMAPYRAEMLIEARSKTIRRATYSNRVFIGRVFAVSENLQKTKLAYAAIRRSKAARDRILVDTQTVRARTFGDGIPMDGSFSFGDHVKKRLR